jgi:hypothetical protein
MNALVALPAVLSMLVLAAHFLRGGAPVLALACAAAPPLLLLAWRRTWAVKLLQAMLILGALLWIRTVIVHIDQREAAGRPWMRMAIILGAVALFTFLSGLLLSLFRTRGASAAPGREAPPRV